MKDPTNPVYEPFELLTAHDCPHGSLVHGGVQVRSRQYSYIDLLSHSELESLTFRIQAPACDPDDMNRDMLVENSIRTPVRCTCMSTCMIRVHDDEYEYEHTHMRTYSKRTPVRNVCICVCAQRFCFHRAARDGPLSLRTQ